MKVDLKEFIAKWWGVPAALVAGFASIGAIITFFGFSLKTPASNVAEVVDLLGVHTVEERSYHEAQKMEAQNQQTRFDSLMKAVAMVSEHQQHLEALQEKALRGECLENSVEQLQLQGLILECRRLGIDRR